MESRGPVEGIFGGQVHQGQVVSDDCSGQIDQVDRVGPLGQVASLGSLGLIHIGLGRDADNDVVATPVSGGHDDRVRNTHLRQVDAGGLRVRLW